MPQPRTHSLDNLRTFLTILVILHHASVPYGGLGSWPYSPSPTSPSSELDVSSLALALFNIVNQTFFMALFFLISGYFSAMAAEKRTRGTFLKEKGKRLGVPCAVYSVFGPGLVEIIISKVRDGAGWRDGLEGSLAKVVAVRGARGPVWYCSVLLMFDLVFAFTSYPRPAPPATIKEKENQKEQEVRKPHTSYLHNSQIFSGLAASVLLSFILRLYYPIGTTFTPLGLEIGFLPQYVVYYATGISAHRSLKTDLHRLVPRSSVRIPRTFTAVRAVVGILLLSVYVAMFPFLFTRTSEKELRGGLNALAACYAVFNETLGFLLSVFFLRLFSEMDGAGRKWSVTFGYETKGLEVDVVRWSYAAFLVHGPIVVGAQCALDGWGASAIVKSCVVGTVGVVGSWVAGCALGQALIRIGAGGYV